MILVCGMLSCINLVLPFHVLSSSLLIYNYVLVFCFPAGHSIGGDKEDEV